MNPSLAINMIESRMTDWEVEKLLGDLGSLEVLPMNSNDEVLHVCLNPMHDDHNPSASYNVEKNKWRCFSCGAQGGIVGLVMMVKQIRFKPAVKWLSERFGLTNVDSEDVLMSSLEWRQKATEENRKVEELYIAQETQLPYHYDSNWKGAKDEIRSYMSTRNFSKLVLHHWGIGFCNSGYWSDRIIIPFVQWDKVVGFTARSIYDKEEDYFRAHPDSDRYAKYMHKASTPIDQVIFGHDAGYKSSDPVFVEGSFDCIRLRTHGINCYSTLSNNVSESQAKMIERYHDGSIIVMPDNDLGGKLMVEKFVERMGHKWNVKVCQYPKGKKDPDSLTKVEALGMVRTARDPFETSKVPKRVYATTITR